MQQYDQLKHSLLRDFCF